MRQKIKVFVIIFLFATIAALTLMSIYTLKQNAKRVGNISTIPSIIIHSIDGKVYNLNKVKDPLLLILFNSECEHCKAEADLLYVNREKLKNVSIVFISEEPVEKIIDFAKKHFENAPYVTFASISNEQLYEVFKVVTYPNILIYDEVGTLINEYKGEVKIEAILASLNIE